MVPRAAEQSILLERNPIMVREHAASMTTRALIVLVCCSSAGAVYADPIHSAVQRNDAKEVEKILKANPKAIDTPDKKQQQRTPLITLVARSGSIAVFDVLMKHKPKLNLADASGHTALHLAAMNRRPDFVRPLMAAGADIGIRDKQKKTPLDYAIMYRTYGGQDVTGLLLAGVTDVNSPLPGGQLPLHVAARLGYKDAVKILLKRKANPAAKDEQGRTALEFAMLNDQARVAELLIVVTDVRRFKTTDGETLLHWAAARGLTDAVASLIERKVDVNAKNADGDTPLHVAAASGKYKACGLLLDAGARVNAADASGRAALYGAAWNRHLRTVTTLVKGGAKVGGNSPGYTPLHAACWQGHEDVARALLDFGADPNGQDTDGATPLHKAAWRGHAPVVKRLLKAKADPNKKDHQGFTPLVMARSAKRNAVVVLLEGAK